MFLTCFNQLCPFNYFGKSYAYIEQKFRMLKSVFLHQWNLSRKRGQCFKKCDFKHCRIWVDWWREEDFVNKFNKNVYGCKCIRLTIRTNLWCSDYFPKELWIFATAVDLSPVRLLRAFLESPFLACINVLLLSSSHGHVLLGFKASEPLLCHWCTPVI